MGWGGRIRSGVAGEEQGQDEHVTAFLTNHEEFLFLAVLIPI